MADRDAPLIFALLGLPADFVQMAPGRVEVEVEMKIDVDVEFPREIENAREMRIRVGVGIGAAADHLAAVAQRLHQQLFAAGIIGQAFLRKDAEREVERPGIVALQRLHGLEAAQADAWIDLDMGAHAGRAVHDRALDHPGAARIDILDAEVPFHRRHGADGIAKTAVIVPAAFEQAGLVEMDVSVDEAGQGQSAADVDLDRVAGKPGLNRSDPAAFHADIDGCGG